jgi:hypothetical protein
MNEAIPPLPQYAFMAWCSVIAQGQLYHDKLQLDQESNPGHLEYEEEVVILTLQRLVGCREVSFTDLSSKNLSSNPTHSWSRH